MIEERISQGMRFEEVGNLRAKRRHKKTIPEARVLSFEPISALCDEFHFGRLSQGMGAFRKQLRKHNKQPSREVFGW
jgi:hypothetical protein